MGFPKIKRTVSIAKELLDCINLTKQKQLGEVIEISKQRDLAVELTSVANREELEIPILVRAYTYLTGKHLPVALSETELRNHLLQYDGNVLTVGNYSYFYYLLPICPRGANVGVMQITGEIDLVFALYATETWDGVKISLLVLQEDFDIFSQMEDKELKLRELLKVHKQPIAYAFGVPEGRTFTIDFTGCPFSTLEETDELLSF